MAYSDVVLADSPLAFYRLGDASGSALTDSSGNARNGTYSTTNVTYAAPSLTAITPGITLASGGNALIADATWQNTGAAITVEAWIKPSGTGGRTVFAKDNTGSTGTSAWRLGVNTANQVQFLFWHSALTTVTGTTTLQAGVWYHIAGTYSVASGNAIVYVNGVAETTIGGKTGSITSIVRDVYIGRLAGGSELYTGSIDEVALYGTALSAARVLAHAQEGSNPTGASVSGLTAYPYSGGGVVSWAPQGGPVTYDWRLDGGSVTNTALTKVSLNGLVNGTTYNFEVRAVNPLGTGEWTSVSFIPVVAVFDSFDRTNVVPSSGALGNAESGQTWTQPGTNFVGISGNAAYATTAGAEAVIAGFGYNVDASTVLQGTAVEAQIIFRYRDISNHWMLTHQAANTVQLYYKRAGTYNTMVSIPLTVASGEVLRVVALDSAIRIYVNDKILITVEDTQSLVTDAGVGIRLTPNTSRIDQFYARPPLATLFPDNTSSRLEMSEVLTSVGVEEQIGHVYKGRDTKILDTIGAA